MSKEKAIDKIQYAVMQVASVWGMLRNIRLKVVGNKFDKEK